MDHAHPGHSRRRDIAGSVASPDPARLDHVGTALSGHTPISFAAAVTGPHNMVAAAITRNTSDLYRYLAEHIGPLPGVQYVETAPALRQIKRLG
jgi:DNA-binding Lrp family transcriptional regulator